MIIGDISSLGLSAGASAPEVIVDEIIEAFRAALRRDGGARGTATETEDFLVIRELRDVELTRRHGLRQRRRDAAWPSTPTSPRTISARSSTTMRSASCVLQGHRRRLGEHQFPAAHRRGLLHPDALREAGRQRRPAVLSRPDGPSGRKGHSCPLPVHAARWRADRLSRRPSGRRDYLSRRHVDAPPDGRPLPRSRQGAGSLHLAGADFPLRPNALAIDGWRKLWDSSRDRADEVQPGLDAEVDRDFDDSSATGPRAFRPASSMPISSRTMSSSSATSCPA